MKSFFLCLQSFTKPTTNRTISAYFAQMINSVEMMAILKECEANPDALGAFVKARESLLNFVPGR